jgi:hypothetical protein
VNLRRLHSCRRTRDHILDLVFKEKTEPARSHLLTEVEACSGCLEHYLGLADTLRIFDDASALAEPDESTWRSYEARLEQKLTASAGERAFSFARLRRVFRSSVRIPLPLAAGFSLSCITAILVLGFRQPSTTIVQVPVPVPGAVEAKERIVEVPVIQEKVVTRKVYVDRKPVEVVPETKPVISEKNERIAQDTSIENGGSITRANLAGFQPATDLRLRVIRRSEGENK